MQSHVNKTVNNNGTLMYSSHPGSKLLYTRPKFDPALTLSINHIKTNRALEGGRGENALASLASHRT